MGLAGEELFGGDRAFTTAATAPPTTSRTKSNLDAPPRPAARSVLFGVVLFARARARARPPAAADANAGEAWEAAGEDDDENHDAGEIAVDGDGGDDAVDDDDEDCDD